jgi:metallo-beta-lactamase family protein
VRDAASRKGALLIPAFAVERTQELIADLIDLMERGEIPAAPIFLDSPLAIRATEVFRKHAESLDPSGRRAPAAELPATAVHRDGR